MQEIDELSDEAASLNEKFDELEQQLDTHRLGSNIIETGDLLQEHEARRDLLDNVAQPLIKRGEHLINSIKANEPPIPPSLNFPGSSSAMPSQERQQMETIVSVLMHRYNQLLDMWEKRWKELMQCMDLREFEAGYKKVCLRELYVVLFPLTQKLPYKINNCQCDHDWKTKIMLLHVLIKVSSLVTAIWTTKKCISNEQNQ